MHDILIAIGTNVIADRIRFVEVHLEQCFENVRFTHIIPTEPIGERFKGKQFFNAVMAGKTNLAMNEVEEQLKRIEQLAGNTQDKRNMGVVEADIDLLMYDDVKLHEKDWQRSYIKELVERIKEMKS
ncbi:2-amino-4-hydroxy-6-hydroxymethyldihydropteridine diphosphokinase [uncultured Prevotella sp.]|uniref:2-amino-4-hydroxy-6- hydroxymethyldihydropteridine diphosphokinase n=1 Tax=uncultured Prevotella sp. TaxID=159272 RepID=UPI0027E217D4|nr:2-amino-4-hydroxy-6-hydroxymethyldihydropteridine diphosphokinase [uncultured Prevotella sp.]